MASRVKWRGKEVAQAVAENVAKALGEFGLRAEGYAKKELYKGHGVETGTLRRSIHTAQPGYNWSADAGAVTIRGKREKGSSFTLGGEAVDAVIEGDRIVLLLGSGLQYALPVHQGHHSFQGYHFLTNGLEKALPELPMVLERHKLKG